MRFVVLYSFCLGKDRSSTTTTATCRCPLRCTCAAALLPPFTSFTLFYWVFGLVSQSLCFVSPPTNHRLEVVVAVCLRLLQYCSLLCRSYPLSPNRAHACVSMAIRSSFSLALLGFCFCLLLNCNVYRLPVSALAPFERCVQWTHWEWLEKGNTGTGTLQPLRLWRRV